MKEYKSKSEDDAIGPKQLSSGAGSLRGSGLSYLLPLSIVVKCSRLDSYRRQKRFDSETNPAAPPPSPSPSPSPPLHVWKGKEQEKSTIFQIIKAPTGGCIPSAQLFAYRQLKAIWELKGNDETEEQYTEAVQPAHILKVKQTFFIRSTISK